MNRSFFAACAGAATLCLAACSTRTASSRDAGPEYEFDGLLRELEAQDPAVQESAPQGAASKGGEGTAEDARAEREKAGGDLALKLQNPIANLISVPFQTNIDYGYGPKHASRTTVNIQPVIPFSLNEDWNLISRTILPVIHAESPSDGVDDEDGLGDTLQSCFFSPAAPVGGWIVGFGPVFALPTATEDEFGTEKWSAGPTVVVLRQDDGTTLGLLANHLWSFAGNGDRDEVNSTFLQPFLSHTFPSATSLGINTESTYDWRHDEWTVPVNVFAAQVVHLGQQPMSITLGYRHYFDAPSGGPEWGVRLMLTFLFPS